MRWHGVPLSSLVNSEKAEAYIYFFGSSTATNIVPPSALHIPGSQ